MTLIAVKAVETNVKYNSNRKLLNISPKFTMTFVEISLIMRFLEITLTMTFRRDQIYNEMR